MENKYREEQPLRGKPIREGELWQLSTEEAIQRVRLSLYVNGLAIIGDIKRVSWPQVKYRVLKLETAATT